MRKYFSLVILIILMVVLALPVSADAVKIGDKIVIEGGYEAVVIDITGEGKPVYKTTFGIPKYLPDLKTLYNTTWSDNGSDYQSGANLFTSSVQGGMVTVQDKKGNALTWQPSVTIENFEKAKDKSGVKEGIQTVLANKGKLLAIDPINPNYKNNTLEWDYGNGLLRRLRIIEGMVQEYFVITKEIGGDVNIKSNMGKSANYKSDRQAFAYDADRNPISLTVDADHNVKLTKVKSLEVKVKYPVTIDPDSTFVATASDGYINKGSLVSFADARTSAAGDNALTTGIVISSGYSTYPIWWISRGFVYFDTSSLEGYVITAATMGLRGQGSENPDGYSIQIQNGQPTYPHDPMVVDDYFHTNYAGNAGAVAMAAWVNTGYNVFTITDLAVINQTGTTKLILRMTGDINNTAPTGQNQANAYSSETGTGYQPYLTVTYTALTPGVTSQPASMVAKTTARLNAAITGDGGADCQISWGYGTTTQTAINFAAYDTVTAFAGAYRVGDMPYSDITGLIANTTYYYRIQVKNVLATITSTSEQTFTTTTGITAISNFYGFPLSTEINLNWVLSSGSSEALLRYRTDTYPTSTTDGVKLYEGTATVYDHTGPTAGDTTGLVPGKTYYYSLWGESGGAYSATAMNLVVTTLGVDPVESDTPGSLSLWPEFFQMPDASGLTNLEPIPTIVNIFATSWGMPVNNEWFMLTMTVITFISFGILLKTKSMAGAGFFAIFAMFIAANLKLMPGWPIAVVVGVLLGGYAMAKMKPQGG